MPVHPQAAAVIQMMNSFGDPPLDQQTPEQARALRKGRARPSTEAIHEIRDLDAGGIACRLYRPSADDGLGLLVFLHGGGWVIGDLDSHDNVCRSLANGSGCAVLAVDYRLAPETKFPGALDDAHAALRWAHENAASLGCDPTRLSVGGDSAGANLATVVANETAVPLRFQLLVYPVTDATLSADSYRTNGQGYFLTTEGMRWFIGHYLDGTDADPRDPRVSPLFADEATLAGGPPAMVITAEFDPLGDEGDQYAQRLATAGVPTNHLRFGGMFHGFFSMADVVDGGKAALAAASAALRAAVEPSA